MYHDQGIPTPYSISSRLAKQGERRKVEPTRWVQIRQLLMTEADALPSCPSGLGVSDGSSFFITVTFDGRVTSTAVYGAILEPTTSYSQDEDLPDLIPCKNVLRAVLGPE
jgi:hypothetical protein